MRLPQLSQKQKQYGLLGVGVVGALAATALWWPEPPRARVVTAATNMLGVTDAKQFWKDVLPPGTPESAYPADWCGAFALWCLHQAGLGKDIYWQVGLGFLSSYLPTTQNPMAGDIAYFNNNEHHAVVTDPDIGIPGSVGLINGNGIGGAVTASTSSNAAAYYSIQPLIDQLAAQGSPVPWLVGGAAVIGLGAYALLPSR
jgi:hypothetical protein